MLAPIAKTILGLVAMVPAILAFLVARTLERRHYVFTCLGGNARRNKRL
jgi:hypothetical protein